MGTSILNSGFLRIDYENKEFSGFLGSCFRSYQSLKNTHLRMSFITLSGESVKILILSLYN